MEGHTMQTLRFEIVKWAREQFGAAGYREHATWTTDFVTSGATRLPVPAESPAALSPQGPEPALIETAGEVSLSPPAMPEYGGASDGAERSEAAEPAAHTAPSGADEVARGGAKMADPRSAIDPQIILERLAAFGPDARVKAVSLIDGEGWSAISVGHVLKRLEAQGRTARVMYGGFSLWRAVIDAPPTATGQNERSDAKSPIPAGTSVPPCEPPGATVDAPGERFSGFHGNDGEDRDPGYGEDQTQDRGVSEPRGGADGSRPAFDRVGDRAGIQDPEGQPLRPSAAVWPGRGRPARRGEVLKATPQVRVKLTGDQVRVLDALCGLHDCCAGETTVKVIAGECGMLATVTLDALQTLEAGGYVEGDRTDDGPPLWMPLRRADGGAYQEPSEELPETQDGLPPVDVQKAPLQAKILDAICFLYDAEKRPVTTKRVALNLGMPDTAGLQYSINQLAARGYIGIEEGAKIHRHPERLMTPLYRVNGRKYERDLAVAAQVAAQRNASPPPVTKLPPGPAIGYSRNEREFLK